MSNFFTKYMANEDFSEPPRRADSKNPIFFFSRFLGLGHLRGPGVSLGRILGVLSIEPFFFRGALARGLDRPSPPLQLKARLPPDAECVVPVCSAVMHFTCRVLCRPVLQWPSPSLNQHPPLSRADGPRATRRQTRGATARLRWAIGEGIAQHLQWTGPLWRGAPLGSVAAAAVRPGACHVGAV